MSSRAKHRLHRPTAAFSLLELLAVLAIILALMGLVIGAGRRAADTGKAARARAELTALGTALEGYQARQGDYPRTADATRLLQALIGRRGPDHQTWAGPALIEAARFTTAEGLDPFDNEQARLVDPWGQPYRYAYRSQTPWSNPSFVLYSDGPDGVADAALLPGGFPNRNAPGNADNLYHE